MASLLNSKKHLKKNANYSQNLQKYERGRSISQFMCKTALLWQQNQTKTCKKRKLEAKST